MNDNVTYAKNSNSIKVASNRLSKIFLAGEITLIIGGIQQFFAGRPEITYATIAIVILMIPVYLLAKKNKPKLGMNILLLSSAFVLLGFIWSYAGLRDEALFVFPALIMISLLQGNSRFSFYMYILVSVNILAIGYLNELGYIHHEVEENNINSAILLVIILTFISYIAWLISVEMNQTNKALIESKDELENRVKKRTIALEKSLKNLTSTQEQLIQTEKMASLGRLVAGVAHEINTPIGIAITASSHLEDSTDNLVNLYDNNLITRKSLEAYVETATKSTKLLQSNLARAADLIQGFKEVAVDQSNDQVREFELKHYINDVLASLHPKIKRSGCQVILNSHDKLFIKTSPGAIAQIITNLVINAITHAFEDQANGTITINVEQKGNDINIQFKDSGCGIAAENLPKIFEPFFTTKRGEGGSGLGMHIVYNLVTQSLNGDIKCTSVIGQGTCFLINFPVLNLSSS